MAYRATGKQVLFEQGGEAHHIADAVDDETALSFAAMLNQRSGNFIKNALRTCSPNFYGEKVSRHHFVHTLNEAISAANQLDKVKKTLFYGRDNNVGPHEGQQDISDIAERMQLQGEPEVAYDLIHGIIGKFTEAGELLEALKAALNGDTFDFTNLIEEIGDGFWYDAILLNQANYTFEEVQDRIIEKLRARFPDKYSDESANVRNLEAERVILEASDPVNVGKAKVEAQNAFEQVNAVEANMIDAPVTTGSGGELHKSPAERIHPLPGEHLAHQHIRREDKDR